jgi:hypothetical protein
MQEAVIGLFLERNFFFVSFRAWLSAHKTTWCQTPEDHSLNFFFAKLKIS